MGQAVGGETLYLLEMTADSHLFMRRYSQNRGGGHLCGCMVSASWYEKNSDHTVSARAPANLQSTNRGNLDDYRNIINERRGQNSRTR